MLTFKDEVDRILKDYPDDYVKELSHLIRRQDQDNDYIFLGFCLGYLPYSIIEEILLYNYTLLDSYKKDDWIKLIYNIECNPAHGKNALRKFLQFHTMFSDDYLSLIGLESDKKGSKQSESIQSEYLISALTRDNPRVQRLYRRLGLSDKDIQRIHSMAGK